MIKSLEHRVVIDICIGFFIYSKYVHMVGYDIRLDSMDDVRIMQIPFQIFNLSPETKNVGILSFYSKYFLSDQWTFERII
jgi:hypothetical protein